MRRFYCDVWKARRTHQALDPLQQQVAEVIEQHPEYHALLEQPEHALGREWPPELGETNPFLHLGLHLGLREQIATDRPAGIRALHCRLLDEQGDRHALEHRMMECLAEMLWRAQRDGGMPDEETYLNCLESLGKHG